jgi:PAS domain-containing protein
MGGVMKDREAPHDYGAIDAVLAEQRVRALFDHSPFAIQVFAPNGQTRHVNRAYTELWGLSGEQLAGFNVLDDARLEAAGLTPLIRRGFAGEALTIPPMRYTPEARRRSRAVATIGCGCLSIR